MIAFASSSTALFQSTLPSQGATNSSTRRFAVSLHFNPRSPHRERLYAQFNKYFEEQFQSTLPSQGATRPSRKRKQWQKISIHAPLTGSDKKRLILTIQEYLFQSTLPSQGATNCSIKSSSSLENFNPRSPHRERLFGAMVTDICQGISIHAPLTGSDGFVPYDTVCQIYFNPRSPHRERQVQSLFAAANWDISIHAPLTGSDSKYTHKIPL